jgi:hypothetical protein
MLEKLRKASIARLLYWAATLQLRDRLRELRVARRLRESGEFDEDFYRAQYSDLGRIDPVLHYVRHGAREGRNPESNFDSFYYLASNPDVAAAGRNPFDHFLDTGREEGRPASTVVELAPCIESHPISCRRDAAVRSRRSHADDPVVVVVSHVCAFPPRAGNEYRIERYVRWLESRGYQVIVVCCPLVGGELDERALERAANEAENFVYCERNGVLRTALAPHLCDLVEGLHGTKALPLSWSEANRCAPETPLSEELEWLERVYCPDVLLRVLLHMDSRLPARTVYFPTYVFNTRYLPLLGPERLTLLDTIDVFASKAEKVCAFGIEDGLAIKGSEERALLLRADVVMAIQRAEAQSLAVLVPERRVIDVAIDFDTVPEESACFDVRGSRRVLMLGSANLMNVKGLQDFLAFVWPFVLRDHPDAELVVGGAVSDFVPAHSPRVRVLGFVDSLEEPYRDCRLAINPAVAGTGLKVKTIECLAHWRPIVSWPAGVEGLPPELIKFCRTASDAYEFYLEIAKLLSEDRKEAFGEEDRATIRFALSGAHVYRELGEVVDSYARPRRARSLSLDLDSQAAPNPATASSGVA